MGLSSGAALALGATARCDAVNAVVPYGPLVPSVVGEQGMASLGVAATRTGELAAEGRLEDALRVFLDWHFTEDDMAGAEAVGYFEAAARYVPNLLGFLQVLQEAQTFETPLRRIWPCSLRSRCPYWYLRVRTREARSWPARSTWLTMSPMDDSWRSPAPDTLPTSPIPRRLPRPSPSSSRRCTRQPDPWQHAPALGGPPHVCTAVLDDYGRMAHRTDPTPRG